jgi:hypothetical protein
MSETTQLPVMKESIATWIASRPGSILVAQFAAVFLAAWISSDFQTTQTTDSILYLDLAKNLFSWDSLGRDITLGYPFLLRCLGGFDAALGSLPYFQLCAYFLGVWVFYRGLVACQFPALLASILASALLYYPGLKFFTVILTDSTALAAGVGSMGFLLCTVGRGWRRDWLGLMVAVALCWMLRPAYLFVLGALPLIGCVVFMVVRESRDISSRVKITLRLIAATSLPLLVFCSLRWMVVGNFGLVSSGGMNLVGITGQFLEREMIPKLPPDLQPLANKIVETREKPSGERPSMLAEGSRWTSPRMGTMGLDRELLINQYNEYVWHICYRATGANHLADSSAANRDLGRIAMEALKLEWLRYGNWFIRSVGEALVRMEFRSARFGVLAFGLSSTL